MALQDLTPVPGGVCSNESLAYSFRQRRHVSDIALAREVATDPREHCAAAQIALESGRVETELAGEAARVAVFERR